MEMRTRLDDAIGVVPPSTVDVDRLIARRRRVDRYRRTGFAAGATVGVAALVVGVAAVGAVTSAPVAADQPVTEQVAGPPEDPAQIAARLTVALRAVVAEKAPGFTASADDVSTAPFLVRHIYREGDKDTVPADHYLGSGLLTDTAGSGQLLVTIDSGRTVVPEWARRVRESLYNCEMQAAGEKSCQVVTGPGGERITQKRFSGDGNRFTYWVRILRPDRTELLLTAANDGGQGDTGPTRRALPVLTIEQLVAIGTDARLSF